MLDFEAYEVFNEHSFWLILEKPLSSDIEYETHSDLPRSCVYHVVLNLWLYL